MKPKKEFKKDSGERKNTTTPCAVKTKALVTEEAINKRAYQIYLETGNTNEHENWLRAEKELKGK